MKTLFITNTYLVGNSGGVYATKAYINAFAILSELITVVYATNKGFEAHDIIERNVNLIPVYDKRSQYKKFVDLCFGTVNRFQKNLLKYINPMEYDTVVFNNSVVSSGLIKKFKQLGLRIITIHHNYQIEYLRSDSNLLTLLPNLFWTYIYEGISVRNSDFNLTLTDEDIDLLKNHYGEANFANIGVFEFRTPVTSITNSTKKRGNKYIITGWLGSKQTEDSLIPWIKNYFPLLKEIDPLASLTIAGREPSSDLCVLAKENGIKIIASPVDMQPILDAADYYICPTDRGGGLKLRNMDGLKSGLPVLTHVVSARGYDYMKEKGLIFSYDSKESFKRKLSEMLCCNYSKTDIQREYVNYYSLEAGTNRLNRIISVV